MNIQISLTSSFQKSLILCFALLFTMLNVQAQDEEKSSAGLYNEGLALLKAKDYAAGLPLLEAALAKAEIEENEKVIGLSKKNGAIAAYNVGNALLKEKKYEEAVAIFKKGMEMNPKYASNYTGVANVLNKQEKKAEAVDQYLLGIEIASENGKDKKVNRAYNKLNSIIGKTYTSKKFDMTIELGEKVLATQSTAPIHYYVARAMLEKGMNEKALENAEKAIATATEVGAKVEDKYHVAVGKANSALGNKPAAIAAYEKVTGDKYKEQAQYQISQLKG